MKWKVTDIDDDVSHEFILDKLFEWTNNAHGCKYKVINFYFHQNHFAISGSHQYGRRKQIDLERNQTE